MEKTRSRPPVPRRLRDDGLRKWMTDRGYDYDLFVTRVGGNPDNPTVPKERLARETKTPNGEHPSKQTIYRWLAELKYEMNLS